MSVNLKCQNCGNEQVGQMSTPPRCSGCGMSAWSRMPDSEPEAEGEGNNGKKSVGTKGVPDFIDDDEKS